MDSETFVMHVAIREQEEMAMNPDKKAQSRAQNQDKAQVGFQSRAQAQEKAKIGALLFNKAPIEVPAEYSDYSNVFLAENAVELPENSGMNEHAIELEEDKQPPFRPIYSLGLVKLETLKIYIETILANDFIRPFKSPAEAPILFDRKPDRSFRLCVDY